MAMLLCLDHNEASEIIGINKSTYRKQLSRAKQKVEEFTQESCGLVNNEAACSCEKKVTCAIKKQRINPNNLSLAKNCDELYSTVKKNLNKTKKDLKSLFLHKSVPLYRSPESFYSLVEKLVG